MKVLAIYNIKGGVGKTAAAVNLSYLAALGGRRVLLWDLDPQAASTFYLRIKPKVKGGGDKLIRGKRELDDAIKSTDYAGLDLLPADFSLRHSDLSLEHGKKPQRRLRELLKPLAGDYDYVFMDCPPSISLLSEAIFGATQAVLVPLLPTTLSLRSFDQVQAFIKQRDFCNPLMLLPFFSMVDRRKKLHCEIVDAAAVEGASLLKQAIPYASEVERMGLERAPLVKFEASCPAARAYAGLWQEIQQWV